MHDWDPYEEMMKLQHQAYKATETMNRLLKVMVERDQTIKTLLEQSNIHTGMLNDQQEEIAELHNRVRLLEMTRQYERK
ncbi:hypothetical protein UFOVP635_8 [uncultured Caudovirales phage]|uniref:Uncharacterized protein n=1 Tax=uncultured Caudovirales phage TaxID=2100421 RepID=A0A6J5N590_9CAUD|nr:hypothetical protein UFOVP635_8 [uncultured Caudovirales phage]